MSASPRKFWGQKTFCLITGASQGIGRGFAVKFSQKFSAGSCIVLLARSVTGLEETKNLILKSNPEVDVKVHAVDLSKPDVKTFQEILSPYSGKAFELTLLINNAGSTGNSKHLTIDMNDLQEWNSYMTLNLYSVTMLTSEFLKVFISGQRCIVNITSLCAVQPFKSLGYYCVGKASREMYFKVLAEENPSLDVLNYSPGPVETDMVTNVIDNIADEDTKDIFVKMKTSKTLLTVDQTTAKAMEVLATGKYTSGGRVDYFDSL